VLTIHADFDPNPIVLDFYATLYDNLIDKVDVELKSTNSFPLLVRNVTYDLISLREVELCWGCRNDQPGQNAHIEGPHGCMYVKEEDELLEKEELINLPQKKRSRSSTSSSSLNLFQ
jgi:hypothetical protein